MTAHRVEDRVDVLAGPHHDPVSTFPTVSDSLVAFVEIPKGSSNKYEWDEELGAIKLDRLLFSSLGYPTDYGFFRETLAADGDPLDAMIIVSEPTFPGCLIEVKPVALFRMRDQN